jgi:hypothetical protein
MTAFFHRKRNATRLAQKNNYWVGWRNECSNYTAVSDLMPRQLLCTDAPAFFARKQVVAMSIEFRNGLTDSE